MSTAVPLPAMTVEYRDSTDAHGIPPPNTSEDYLCEQLNIAVIMNDEAKSGPRWPEYTTNYLVNNCRLSPAPDENEIKTALAHVMRFSSWKEVVWFVQDDMCVEFFAKALAYLVKIGAQHRNSLDFIDGFGVGYTTQYVNRLKTTLEHAFDAKYFYQVKRPLNFSWDRNNMDLTRVANKINPGHWSYPAGHGTKFFTAVEVLNEVFVLTTQQYRNLFIAAYVCGMGRSGSLIHYPFDNEAGGYLTTLPEFQPVV